MKTIGLLGGMSWESTATYYRAINEGVREKLGGLHSAKICMISVDFAEIEQLQHSGNWEETGKLLGAAARQVEAGGADFLVLCTNTMHKVAPAVEAAIAIPVLHIADATAAALQADGRRRVGLLGTRFTMQEEFYKGRLQNKFGIDVLVPDDGQQEMVHEVIYRELCMGKVRPGSRERYLAVIADLQQRGAEAVILGCTEIALLVDQSHTVVPLYDTTTIHARQAVLSALA